MSSVSSSNELPLSATQESPLLSKKTISKDKQSSSKKNTPSPKSSKTSALGSISNEKAFKPYWNDLCPGLNSKLWLPTETALQDSDSTSLTSLHQLMAEKSWFSIKSWTPLKKNSQRIFSQSFTTSPVECTGKEVTLTRKIRIHPTTKQKQLFNQWLGLSRKLYNQTIDKLNSNTKPVSWMTEATDSVKALPDWSKSTPYQIKRMSVKEAFQTYSACVSTYKRTKKPSKMRFRSKKDLRQSCYLPKTAISNNGIYYTMSGELLITEELPSNILDGRLLKEKDRWYIVVPYKTDAFTSENQGRVVALDPGVRTFLTGFSEDSVFKIAEKDISRIVRLGHFADKIASKMSGVRSKKHYCLRKAFRSILYKIRCLVDELHWKTANYLVNNFDVILLPSFEVSGMVMRRCRKIGSKVVRSMLGFAHYRFSQRLEFKCKQHGKILLEVDESYTSKTVSWTGRIVNIGSRKKISDIGMTMDRDINGARGIFLRALVDSPTNSNIGCKS